MISQVGSAPSPGTRQQIALTLATDVEADLALVKAPSLIIAGTLDNFVDPIHSGEMAAGIKGAQLLELDGGHGVMFEKSAEVSRAISELIRSAH